MQLQTLAVVIHGLIYGWRIQMMDKLHHFRLKLNYQMRISQKRCIFVFAINN